MLGLGETGLSMAKWLAGRGARVRVADSREAAPGLAELRAAVPDAEAHLGGWRDASFEGIDLLAISPGISRATPQVQRALVAGIDVVGDVELFARALSSSDAAGKPRILAITGTNGKSTVTALTGAMCRAAGLDAEVAGNISPAVLDALAQREARGVPAAAWVLELSSFQLESTSSLAPDAATMLNLSEDHLDRHGSMAEYAAAKARIFHGHGAQVLNRDDPSSLAMARPGRTSITFGLDAPRRAEDYGLITHAGEAWLARGDQPLIAAGELPIAGRHNAANALAALALCRAIELPLAPLIRALREFRGLPHRVEFVAEQHGVRFYDDSKGTNVGSTVAALSGLASAATRVVLIAGGEGKGQDFRPLRDAVASAGRAIVLIGRDAQLIRAAVDGAGVPVLLAGSMEEAVAVAKRHAHRGDAVLLSPACASFDMFRNYAHRGDVFQSAVKAQTGRPGHA